MNKKGSPPAGVSAVAFQSGQLVTGLILSAVSVGSVVTVSYAWASDTHVAVAEAAWLPTWAVATSSAALVLVPWCAFMMWQFRKLARVVHAVRQATVVYNRKDLGAGLIAGLEQAVGVIKDLQWASVCMARRHVRARDAMQALLHGGEAVILLTGDGHIELMNPAAELLFRTARDSTTYQLLRERLCAVGSQFLDTALASLGDGSTNHPKPKETRCELRGRDGRAIQLDMSVCEIDLGGQRVLSVHALERRDATPVDPMGDDGQKKARYVSMLGHELRTPLNTLIGAVNQLAGETSTAVSKDLIGVARESTRAIRSLIDDLLDLAKVDAGKLELEEVPFDVCQQVGQCVHDFLPLATSRGLSLRITKSLEERTLIGDPRRVTQLVSNLLANAIKFTTRGGVQVRVSGDICKADDACCEVMIEVEDTGIGMDEAEQARIFEPFTQANASISRRYGGTGLGLALCREWAFAMGGTISVASALDVGSVFTVRLRLRRAFGAAVFKDSEPPTDEVRELAGKSTVLVADDNVLSQHLLKRWLNSECMSVQCVGNGEEAVAAASAGDFDVILMDVSMPKMNGIDATKIIRGLPSVTRTGTPRRTVQIIGITAFDMTEDRVECLAAGMNDYITKPIDRTELLGKIAQAQRRRRKTRQLGSVELSQ